MFKGYGTILMVCIVVFGSLNGRAEGAHRFGVGVHYLTTVDDLELTSGSDNGMAYVVSYQYAGSEILKLEIDVEVMPNDWLGSTEDIYAPHALLLIGSGLYAGVGIGTYYSDGDFSDDNFYLLRAGLNLDLLPSISIDINLNYQFSDYEGIDAIQDDIQSDTITLGASARIAF